MTDWKIITVGGGWSSRSFRP